MWIVAMIACQEPFGADRHDLLGFRIAAVEAPATQTGGTLTPRVAVIVDGRAWSPGPVDLAWYWVGDTDDVLAIDPLTEADGFGPAPVLEVPSHRRRLAVLARTDDDEQRAFLDVPLPPATVPVFSGIELRTLPLAIDTLEGTDLLLASRETVEAEIATHVAPGGMARLTAQLEEGDGDPVVRWMSTAGSWFELDARQADWAAGDVRLDDDEVEGSRTPLEPGPVTMVGLVVQGDGQTAFRATEVHVDPPGDGLWVAGRWLPTDGPVTLANGDAVRGVLVADDDSPVGVRLEGGAAEDAETVPARGWGTPAMSCLVARDGPFDPTWLLTQHCGRDGITGVEVVVVPE